MRSHDRSARRFAIFREDPIDVTRAEALPIGAGLFAIVDQRKALLESHPCAILCQ
jgi:hypothetical protein